MFDDLLRTASERLARGDLTRRRLIGGAAVGVVGTAVLAGCGDGSSNGATATATAATTETAADAASSPVQSGLELDAKGRPKDCNIARGRIHVCYTPWRVVRSEPAEFLPKGVQGVAVRKGPEPDAPIIYKYGKPCVIKVGGIFARQSLRQDDRTGGEAHNCPAPPIRPERGVRGASFVWGHPGVPAESGTYNKGGWIAHTIDGVTYSVDDPSHERAMCGPADLDFDCRAGNDPDSRFKADCRHSARPQDPGFKCNGGETTFGHCGTPHLMEVGIQENIDEYPLIGDLSHERYNLKYQADSTTIFWLVPGDLVKRSCYKCTLYNPSKECPAETADRTSHGCCRAYSCVTVVKARYCPAGVSGWINSSVLRSRAEAAREIPKALRETGGSFKGY